MLVKYRRKISAPYQLNATGYRYLYLERKENELHKITFDRQPSTKTRENRILLIKKKYIKHYLQNHDKLLDATTVVQKKKMQFNRVALLTNILQRLT